MLFSKKLCISLQNFSVPREICVSLRSLSNFLVFVSCLGMQTFCEGDFASECRISLGNVKIFRENAKDIFFFLSRIFFFITISLWGSVAFCFGLVQILTFRCSSSFSRCRHISYFSVQMHTRYMLACLVLASGHILSPEHR